MRPTLVFCELVTPAPGVGSAARRRASFLSREAQGADLVSAPGDFRTAARGGWRYRVRRKPRCGIGTRPPGLGRPSAGCPLGDGAGPAGVGGRGRLQEEGLEGVSPEGRADPAPHLNTGREVPEPGGRRPLEEVAWGSMKRPVAVPGQAGSAPH